MNVKFTSQINWMLNSVYEHGWLQPLILEHRYRQQQLISTKKGVLQGLLLVSSNPRFLIFCFPLIKMFRLDRKHALRGPRHSQWRDRNRQHSFLPIFKLAVHTLWSFIYHSMPTATAALPISYIYKEQTHTHKRRFVKVRGYSPVGDNMWRLEGT